MRNISLFFNAQSLSFYDKVRSESELNKHFEYLKKEGKIISDMLNLSSNDMPKFVMQQFSNLFNAYTKAYNKMFDRKGALFIDYMKRKAIFSESYFKNLIHYIHHNPVHHKFCKNPSDWEFSSYHAFISDKKTKVNWEEVLQWFGSKKSFVEFHKVILKASLELEL